MPAITLVYLLLILAAVVLFALHYIAQWRFTALMRRRYPNHWKTIVEADTGRLQGLANYGRVRRVLKSDAPALLDDAALLRWQGWWRRTPWLAWPCWFAALALQWWALRHG